MTQELINTKERSGELLFIAKPAASVKLLNFAGHLLQRAGLVASRLSADDLLHAARRRACCCDLGDDQIMADLKTLLACFENGNALTFIGRWDACSTIIQSLETLLYVTRDIQKYPEITAIPIARPLVVVGFPRTGKTLLQNLLTQHAGTRRLRYWETYTPFPADPREWGGPLDPRPRRFEAALRKLKRKHSNADFVRSYEGTAECAELFSTFRGAEVFGYLSVERYRRWLADMSHSDWVKVYQRYKRRLQHLVFCSSAGHWVLNSPHHTPRLAALLEVFPDARIIQLHRDPREILPPLCRQTYTHVYYAVPDVPPHRIGALMLDILSEWARKNLAQRRGLPSDRICDVHFRDVVEKPREVVGHIYRYFGMQLPDRMNGQLDARAIDLREGQRTHDAQTLEAFGLRFHDIEDQFREYREYFHV